MLRVFVAISIPAEVRDTIRQASTDLRGALPANAVRWVRLEQYHITLKFIGDVAETEVGRLAGVVRASVAGFGPLRLCASGFGVFPSRRRPRVLWASVKDSDQRLARFHWQLDQALTAQGFGEPGGDYTGHVTIGRVNRLDSLGLRALETFEQNMADRAHGHWTAETVVLFRSQMGPAGSQYSALAECSLIQPDGMASRK